jgi:uncharacterized protein (DUF433 family)
MRWQDHITVDPEVCHGQACFTGTRILVTVVLDNIAAGVPQGDLLRDYPGVPEDGIRGPDGGPAGSYRSAGLSTGRHLNGVLAALERLLPRLGEETVRGALLIVEDNRIRVRR